MTAVSPSVLRSALVRLRVGLVLQQIGLALLLLLLAVVWLRLPDASVADVMGTILLGLVLLAIAGVGESWLALRLSGQPLTWGRLMRGTLALMMGVALWFAWSAVLDHLHGNHPLWAGYLNSRLPRSLRSVLSYEHIALCMDWTWAAFQWIGTGVLAIVVFAATASRSPLRAMLHVLSCLTYWLVLIVGAICATGLTGSLLQWTPGHGLGIEMVSLALRFSAAVLLDATLISLLLAVLAVCVRRSDAAYSAPGGTPAESHPRTVEGP
jgi:hypothetical protein